MAEYIERESLYQKMEHRYKYSFGAARNAYGIAVDDVLDAPAADVAPVRHGRWNRPYISWLFPLKIKNPYCFCTNCVHPVKPKRKTRYCPNCGAKMDGKAGAEC